MEITQKTETATKTIYIIEGKEYKAYDNGNGYHYIYLGVRKTKGVHRFIMELHIGRTLSKNEHVHHKDGNKKNNSLENLEIIDGKLHNSIHTAERNLKHDPNNFQCFECKRTNVKYKGHNLCDNCWSKQRTKKLAKRPCKECKIETFNRKIYNDLCFKCSSNKYNNCLECKRSREELPKSSRTINGDGFCRACQARLDRK